MDNIFLQDKKFRFYDSPEKELVDLDNFILKYESIKNKENKNFIDKLKLLWLENISIPKKKILTKSFMLSILGLSNPKDYMNLYAGIFYVCLKHKNPSYLENLFKLFATDEVNIYYYDSFDNIEVKVPDYRELHKYKILIVVKGNSTTINTLLEDPRIYPMARRYGGKKFIYKTSFYLDLGSHTMDYIINIYNTDDITLTSTSNIISIVELNAKDNTITNQSIHLEKEYKSILFNYINNTVLINFYIILTALFDIKFNALGETIVDVNVQRKIGT